MSPPLSPCCHQVTNENKKEYVNLVARHRMTTAIREQITAFLTGFWDIVPKELIRCVMGVAPCVGGTWGIAGVGVP